MKRNLYRELSRDEQDDVYNQLKNHPDYVQYQIQWENGDLREIHRLIEKDFKKRDELLDRLYREQFFRNGMKLVKGEGRILSKRKRKSCPLKLV